MDLFSIPHLLIVLLVVMAVSYTHLVESLRVVFVGREHGDSNSQG